MSNAGAPTPKDLFRPLEFVAGVGPERARLLEKLGLRSVGDVLFYFPRSYEDLTTTAKILNLVEGQEATVVGIVTQVDRQVTRAGKVIVGILIEQEMQLMRALWFNPSFGIRDLKKGTMVAVRGKPKRKTMRWEMTHPKVMRLDLPDAPDLSNLASPQFPGTDVRARSGGASPHELPSELPLQSPPHFSAHGTSANTGDAIWLGKFRPVYGLTDGLLQRDMRKIAATLTQRFGHLLEEALPPELMQRHQLVSIHQAVQGIHLPHNQTEVDRARDRLVYQELLILQVGLAMRRHKMTVDANAPILQDTAKIRGRILRLFPYDLTEDQLAAIDEVCTDLARAVPMNRMLQGDVGSGKTVVAIYSILLCIACGFQVALMTPTEVLARQHFDTLFSRLKKSRVRIGLLTGSVSSVERHATETKLAAGEVDVVVGTQTLIRSEIPWQKLGLVIIDEGHKFGVKQRAKLKQGGFDPHYLVMTATPIPRSAAMTLFGDLDLSVIRHAPAGRQTVGTYPVPREKQASWWEFFRKQIDAGHQGFVVVPRIDSAAEDEATVTVKKVCDELSQGPLQGLRIELLHGQMSSDEKNRVMHSFTRGLTQVLISTTVIEVGIDVPQATVMAIYSPQKLGLSQLHQLRGRVGRGQHAGYVGLVLEENTSHDANERLELFCKTTDGFALAEADLRMRGPGDLIGTRQHGLPPLLIADLQKDESWLLQARGDAQALVQADPHLAAENLRRLKKLLLGKYGKALELADVG